MNVAFQPPSAQRIEEFQCVRLLGQYVADEGTLHPGAIGTVVHVHRGGEAYEVEFTQPFQSVLTLTAAEIAPLAA